MLLENNKTLGAIYLHLSYSETIAQSIHYERLKSRKENQRLDSGFDFEVELRGSR